MHGAAAALDGCLPIWSGTAAARQAFFAGEGSVPAAEQLRYSPNCSKISSQESRTCPMRRESRSDDETWFSFDRASVTSSSRADSQSGTSSPEPCGSLDQFGDLMLQGVERRLPAGIVAIHRRFDHRPQAIDHQRPDEALAQPIGDRRQAACRTRWRSELSRAMWRSAASLVRSAKACRHISAAAS